MLLLFYIVYGLTRQIKERERGDDSLARKKKGWRARYIRAAAAAGRIRILSVILMTSSPLLLVPLLPE